MSGNVLDRTFRSGERFEEPDLEEREMQFLYATGDAYTFMDTETYEQLTFEKGQVRRIERGPLERRHDVSKILVYEHRPIDVELPIFIELKGRSMLNRVFAGIRPRAATSSANVETGATIKVPLYLEIGDGNQDRHPYPRISWSAFGEQAIGE